MPDPTTLVGEVFALLTATATEKPVDLDPQKKYSIANLGIDSAGAVSDDIAYLSKSQAVVTDTVAGLDKAILPVKGSLDFGPNVSTLKYKTAAGETTLEVVAVN